MATWTDYKNYVRETNPEIGKDIDATEAVSKIVCAMIKQQHIANLSKPAMALVK